MELQFQMSKIPCLRQVKEEVQTREQTQELRLPEEMPDIGTVLCCWGQCVLRGKQWSADSVGASCGVMAWVLYAPEDGSPARWVEAWIPVSLKWEIPQSQRDGVVNCHCSLYSVDARTLSGRKLMIRVNMGVQASVYIPWAVETYLPEQLPEDILLQKKTYPVCLACEAGEKAFAVEEELTLGASAPALDKIVRYSFIPSVTDQKVLGDKVVFRGSGALHLLYRTQEGALASWDCEIPFSQYTELERDYGHQAQVQVDPQVTGLELEAAEGRLRLKAGISGQYMLYDQVEIPVVEDAYSTDRAVSVQKELMQLQTVLERQSQSIQAQCTAAFGSSRVADVAFYPGAVSRQRNSDAITLELPGVFQTLYYDTQGMLQTSTDNWQTELSIGLAAWANMEITVSPEKNGQSVCAPETTDLQAELILQTVTTAQEHKTVVTGLTVGDALEKDPARPSLILRRAGQQDLWTIAKESGSTVDAIMAANGLQEEPEPEQVLLIPVI